MPQVLYPLTEGKIKSMNTKANGNVGYENQAAAKNLALDGLKDAVAPWVGVRRYYTIMANTKSQINIIELFNKKKPKTKKAIIKLGLSLDMIGEGVFRGVYRIVGTDYVVKIPCCKEGIEHSQSEHNAWSEIRNNRQYRILWKYLPDFKYYDEGRGILVMPYYYPVDTGTRQARRRGNAISLVMHDLIKVVWKKNQGKSIDMHDGNIGLTKYGEPILIDMGYFYGPPDYNDETRKGS